jgi:hypothetical protein
VFADSGVRFIPRRKLSEPAIRALLTRNRKDSTGEYPF